MRISCFVVAALTVWAVLGGSPWRVRLPLAAIAVVVAICFASTMDGKGDWQAAFWCQCVATVCVGLAFWIAGYRVERRPSNGESTREAGEEERWRQLVCRHLGTALTRTVPNTLPRGQRMQFSVWHLFVWTTSAAVILGQLGAHPTAPPDPADPSVLATATIWPSCTRVRTSTSCPEG